MDVNDLSFWMPFLNNLTFLLCMCDFTCYTDFRAPRICQRIFCRPDFVCALLPARCFRRAIILRVVVYKPNLITISYYYYFNPAPASRAALSMYDSASGHVTVTSQHNDLPLCQGTRVTPSGLFPSVRNSPISSLATRTPAEAKLPATNSLRA